MLARFILAMVLVCGTLALALLNRDVPVFLVGFTGAAVGFWFGGLGTNSQA